MEANQRNLTILMFPWLAHGHVFPYLELAKNLSKRNFKIYFCSTAINLTSAKHALGISNIQFVELTLPSFPDLPPHYHTTKNIPPHLHSRLYQAFHKSKSSFSEIITSLKPDLLIYDAFQTWAAKQALSLNIPAVHFATTGATAYSYYYHFFTNRDLPFPFQELYLREHEKKAMQELAVSDMMDKNDDDDFGFEHFTLSCQVVLMKSCLGIEGKYIDYLSLLMKKKVIPVGTLVTEQPVGDENHSEIMEWLSKKSAFSTVYISFGSENYLSRDQVEEMAKGLELCDVNFIWVVRFSAAGDQKVCSLDEILPMGFLENVKGRGVILEGWAPQAKILGHPSVGAFVSHCGMSSIFESIYFGIPVVAVPLKLDQPLNARLVAAAGVGVEVEKDGNGLIRREAVAKAINEAVLGKNGEEMRVKAVELSKKMKSEEEEAMDEAAEQLQRLCLEYKK